MMTRTIGRMQPDAPLGGTSAPKAATSPVATVVQPPSGKNRISFTLPQDVTPEEVRRALDQARRGKPARLYAILEFFLELDDEIAPALQSLTSAVISDTILVEKLEESAEADRQHDVLTALLEDLDGVALLEDLLRGHYFGLRAEWLKWDKWTHEGTAYQAPVTYESLPMSWIYAEKERRTDAYTTLYVGDRPYYAYPSGSLLLFVSGKLPSFKDIDFAEFGRGLAAARYAVFSWYGWEDWAAFAEAFGTPAILGTLMQGWGDRDKELLLQAVMHLQGDARGLITEKGKIDILDSPFKASSTGLFDKIIDASARAKARIIKSESLTDNMNQRGSNAAMITTNGIRLDVAGGLAHRLTRLLRRRMVHPFLDLNFPRRLVKLTVKVEAVADLVQEVKIDQALARLMDLSESELRGRYGRRKPETPEDTVGAGTGSFDPFGGA